MLIYIILYSMLLPGILYDAVRKSLSAKKVVLGFYVLPWIEVEYGHRLVAIFVAFSIFEHR
jgi:hypothetical protein